MVQEVTVHWYPRQILIKSGQTYLFQQIGIQQTKPHAAKLGVLSTSGLGNPEDSTSRSSGSQWFRILYSKTPTSNPKEFAAPPQDGLPSCYHCKSQLAQHLIRTYSIQRPPAQNTKDHLDEIITVMASIQHVVHYKPPTNIERFFPRNWKSRKGWKTCKNHASLQYYRHSKEQTRNDRSNEWLLQN